MSIQKHLLLGLLLLLPCVGFAKKFQNAYLSFDLPPNWNCTMEQTEWICISQYSQRSKEAMIILTAKQVGPTDSFDRYNSKLKTIRTLPNAKGLPTQSKVIHVKNSQIANHPWVDGMQLGSEVPSYYTRYLGTIKDGVAILVTFSAHKAHYTKYSNDFLKAISSLRVIATKELLANRPAAGVRPGNETIGAPIGAHISNLLESDQLPPEPTRGKDNSAFYILLLALILGGTGVYLYFKPSKKAGKRTPKR